MINPSEISDNLVALFRSIPELVAEMEGDPERIQAYHDAYPDRVSAALAMYELSSPGILVIWQGTQPGTFGNSEVWKHQFSLILRARDEWKGEPPAGYYRIFRLLWNGSPDGSAPGLQRAVVHTDCQPADVPTIARATPQEGMDFFEVSVTFTEIGDS